PAVPLAVLAPAWRITALEATGKKAAFVEQVAGRLQIDNLQVVHAHSDHWHSSATFDLVAFKAIGTLDGCLTTGRSYVAPGGLIAVYKTKALSSRELRLGCQAAERLGFEALPAFDYELPAPSGTVSLTLHLFTRSR
ncbi:MAG: RsmG family class I SAM-dependent methyltransferase, partial [Planctomycetota bacterium]